jgi:hypothetical protein
MIRSQRIENVSIFSYAHTVIGEKGEVVVPIDNREGIFIIPSHNSMNFEINGIKSLKSDLDFKRNRFVYFNDVNNDFLSVYNNIKIIIRRG